jgi:cytochrome P450
VSFPDAFSHRCIGREYVARATTVVAKSLLSRMDWLEMRAPSHLRGESALQELKLGKLKDKRGLGALEMGGV